MSPALLTALYACAVGIALGSRGNLPAASVLLLVVGYRLVSQYQAHRVGRGRARAATAAPSPLS